MSDTTAHEVVETHVSWLYLSDELVIKVKKPVRTDFLDFSTSARRAAVCADEVRLNRRLAPDTYLGVACTPTAGGGLEPAVVMRRQPAEWCLRALAERGADLTAQLTQVVDLLATFHTQARRSPEIDEAGTPEHVRNLWVANLRELGDVLPASAPRSRVETAAAEADRYLRGRARLLTSRVRAHRICDGHGDLLASDIFCAPGGAPQILDCLEFDERLRWGDVLADVAFLAMDLERRGRSDAADLLQRKYRATSGDSWPASLAHHYIAYRAGIRAKVACLRLAQGAAEAEYDLIAHLDLMDRHLARGTVRLVLVGGTPGTGKTTLAARLAADQGWTYLSSDVRRKELAGLEPTMRAHAEWETGLYAPASTDATYRSLLSGAADALSLGETVIIDATWADAVWRDRAADTAAEADADLVCLQTVVPDDVADTRIRRRASSPGRVSDADVGTAALVRERFQPWDAVRVDMTAGLDGALHALTREMPGLLCGD